MTPVGSVGNLKRQLKKKPTWCEVADDPVVVSKSRTEKPGNRVEKKTAMTSGASLEALFWRAADCQKRPSLRRGEFSRKCFRGEKSNDVQHK